MPTILKNVYKCSKADAPKGVAFIEKVAEDLEGTLDFGAAFVSPLNQTITTEQDFTHPDYPHYNVVEVEVPDPVEEVQAEEPVADEPAPSQE